jgi:uncharacterized protein (UPF0332 family)
MTPDQAALLRKAHSSLHAAKLLAAEKLFDFSVSRAYYTMFYVAEALLLGRDLSFSKHRLCRLRSVNISRSRALCRRSFTSTYSTGKTAVMWAIMTSAQDYRLQKRQNRSIGPSSS